MTVIDEEKLAEALEAHANGKTPRFPYDSLQFTLEDAASTIRRLRELLEEIDGVDQW